MLMIYNVYLVLTDNQKAEVFYMLQYDNFSDWTKFEPECVEFGTVHSVK